MPQATEAQRARWGISEEKAIDHLESRGFKLTREWTWLAPEGRVPDEDDWSAIDFLIDEYDFAGLEGVDVYRLAPLCVKCCQAGHLASGCATPPAPKEET